MFPLKKEESWKYADYANSAGKAKIILIFLHYAKNYAGTIYKGQTTSEYD